MKNEKLKNEITIRNVKDTFLTEITKSLNLTLVSSPLMVLPESGLNDNLNGVERSVNFPVKYLKDQPAVIVNSLAKWKRLRLKTYDVEKGAGIITDMKAIRPDEDYSPIHSIYVDQWDWEKHIGTENRNISYLKSEVKRIYQAIKNTEQTICLNYNISGPFLPREIKFFHTEELLKIYPNLSPKQREHEVCKIHKAVFLIGIGHKLSHGESHDGRAPDYDDWSTINEDGFIGLNGDILVWNDELKTSFELSSMGIRVEKNSLIKQLEIRKKSDQKTAIFHQMLLNGELPSSIGGGIGQSRLCMFILKKKHIGEVQVSLWPTKVLSKMKSSNVDLL